MTTKLEQALIYAHNFDEWLEYGRPRPCGGRSFLRDYAITDFGIRMVASQLAVLALNKEPALQSDNDDASASPGDGGAECDRDWLHIGHYDHTLRFALLASMSGSPTPGGSFFSIVAAGVSPLANDLYSWTAPDMGPALAKCISTDPSVDVRTMALSMLTGSHALPIVWLPYIVDGLDAAEHLLPSSNWEQNVRAGYAEALTQARAWAGVLSATSKQASTVEAFNFPPGMIPNLAPPGTKVAAPSGGGPPTALPWPAIGLGAGAALLGGVAYWRHRKLSRG